MPTSQGQSGSAAGSSPGSTPPTEVSEATPAVLAPTPETIATGETYPTVDSEITIQGEGTVVGRTRSYSEDGENSQVTIEAQSTQQQVVITQKKNVISASQPATSISTQSNSAINERSSTADTAVAKTAAATRAASIKPKDTNDITRTLQRTQRTCNHTYSKINNRCVYCNKHRDSHVHDV